MKQAIIIWSGWIIRLFLKSTFIYTIVIITALTCTCSTSQSTPSSTQHTSPSDRIETTPSSESFTLAAVGDIMLSRGVGGKIKNEGPDYPFKHISPLLKSADLAMGNLESLISSLGAAAQGKEINFQAAPEVVTGLKNAGIDVLSLANNHAVDYGPEALLETMDILAHNGIAYIGAGANAAAAHRPANFIVKGINISLLAYSSRFHMVKEAQPEQPGIAVSKGEEIVKDLREARKWADVVVVSFHWGWEYSDHPDGETRNLAHRVAEGGADLIIGHHPHVIQGVEWYKGSLICYSLGNFIFDQRGTRSRRGLMLQCRIGQEGIQQAELLPIAINPMEFRPALASGKEAASLLTELQNLSRKLNTEVFLEEERAQVHLETRKQE